MSTEPAATVTLLFGAARLAGFASVAVLVGAAFFVATWWQAGAGQRGTRRLIWGAWGGLVSASAVMLLLFGPQATARPLTDALAGDVLGPTLGTRFGVATLARLAFLALAAPALALLLRPAPPSTRRSRIAAVAAGAVLLATTWSVAGHSAVGGLWGLALTADVAHLVAMGVWLGGLVVLAGVLLRSRDTAVMRTAVPGFSRAALACVAVLVITGSYQGWRQVGGPTALTSTSYGWLLVGKVLLVLVLVGVGFASRSWVHRHYRQVGGELSISARRRARRGPDRAEITRFRRSVAAEAGLAVLVLGLTAALVAMPPARVQQLAAAAEERAAQQRVAPAGPVSASTPGPQDATPFAATARVPFDTGTATGRGSVDLALLPAAVGANEVHVSVLSDAGGLLDVAELDAILHRPERNQVPVRLWKVAPGHYIGAVAVPAAGRWDLVLRVRGGGEDTVRAPIDIR